MESVDSLRQSPYLPRVDGVQAPDPRLENAARSIAQDGAMLDLREGESTPFATRMATVGLLFETASVQGNLLNDLNARTKAHQLRMGNSRESRALAERSGVPFHLRVRRLRMRRQKDRIACSQMTFIGNEDDREQALMAGAEMGRLHYAKEADWRHQGVLAAFTPRPAFGGGEWTTLIHQDIRVLKAYALWANSTFGVLTHWIAGRPFRRRDRACHAIDDISALPCPNFDDWNGTQLDLAAAHFQSISCAKLGAFVRACRSESRCRLDGFAIELLGLGRQPDAAGALSALRDLWSLDPTHPRNAKHRRFLCDVGKLPSREQECGDGYFIASDLRRRGWSLWAMQEFLDRPDEVRRHSHHLSPKHQLKLFLKSRVLEAEATDAFQRERARVLESRRRYELEKASFKQAMIEQAERAPIELNPGMTPQEAFRRGYDARSAWAAEKGMEIPPFEEATAEQLHIWAHNWLRHNCTSYDEFVRDNREEAGFKKAKRILCGRIEAVIDAFLYGEAAGDRWIGGFGPLRQTSASG